MYFDRLEFKRDPFSLLNLDPRCRVAVGIGFIITAINLSKWYLLAGIIAVMLMFLIKEPRVVLLRLIPVNVFNLFLVLSIFLNVWINSFSDLNWRDFLENSGVIEYGPPAMLALRYILRINAAVLVYMLFIVPLGISGLANVLLKIHVPKKLAALLILTYRYIFVIYERLSVSLLSMKLREPKTSTLSRWRSHAAVFAAFLASALFCSRKIEIAMRERSFNGAFPVTALFAWKIQDTVWLAVLLSCGAMLLVMERILM
jgi:energy-coupling factor transporter transmembrane protein EcfT